MASCCDSSGYPGVFNRKAAERYVRSFRKKGLDSTARPMVEALRSRGLDGSSVLEIGAGAGTALVAMLEAGAISAVGIDISPNYEKAAQALMAERGLEDRVSWDTGDFVELADGLVPGDVVFLNRVVCCYPYMEAIVDAAAAKSNRLLAMAYPRRRWGTRLAFWLLNVWLRIRSNTFRVFVHDPKSMERRIESAGFRQVAAGTTALWQWRVWERGNSRDDRSRLEAGAAIGTPVGGG